MIREDHDVKDAMAKLDRLTKQEDRVVGSVTLSVVNTILASLEEQMRCTFLRTSVFFCGF